MSDDRQRERQRALEEKRNKLERLKREREERLQAQAEAAEKEKSEKVWQNTFAILLRRHCNCLYFADFDFTDILRGAQERHPYILLS